MRTSRLVVCVNLRLPFLFVHDFFQSYKNIRWNHPLDGLFGTPGQIETLRPFYFANTPTVLRSVLQKRPGSEPTLSTRGGVGMPGCRSAITE